jgi:hypothetical protein
VTKSKTLNPSEPSGRMMKSPVSWFERPPATVICEDDHTYIRTFISVQKRLNLELISFAIFTDNFLPIYLPDRSNRFRVSPSEVVAVQHQ